MSVNRQIYGLWHSGFAAIARRVIVALCLFVVSVLVADTASAGVYSDKSRWIHSKKYSFGASVGFTYLKHWGDGSAERFGQNYGLYMRGHILDPRLAAFRMQGSFRQVDRGDGADIESSSYGLTLTMLNGINRERGLSLWKYVPMPIVFNYFHYDSNGSAGDTYSFSMSYSRPGYVLLFDGGKVFRYALTREKTQGSNVSNNTGGYRSKYSKNADSSNRNWNRNGNGNWNRNGNGNWNRNGNGNWNRNGNGNWNRNGNGNWNRNGNGNWNRNGNGNWNRNGNGNWNRNGNGNWGGNGNGNWGGNGGGNGGGNNDANMNWNVLGNYGQGKEPKALGFKIPDMHFNHTWSDRTMKDSSQSYSSRLTLFSASVMEFYQSQIDQSRYSSQYRFRYTRESNDRSSISKIDRSHTFIDTHHVWTHTSFTNHFLRQEDHANDEQLFDVKSTLDYKNNIGESITYRALVNAYYRDFDEDPEFYGYSASANGGYRKSRNVRLSYNLESMTLFTASLGLARSEVVSGEQSGGLSESYSLSLNERLTSRHWRRVISYAEGSVAIRKDSLPYKLVIGADSKLRNRGGIHAFYSYDALIPREDYVKEISTHKFVIQGDYKFSGGLIFRADTENRITKRENRSGEEKLTQFRTSLEWRISYRSTTRGEATYKRTEVDQVITHSQFSLHYDYKLSHATDVKCRWLYMTDSNDNTSQELGLSTSTAVRKTSFSAQFKRRDENGVVNNSIFLSLRRSFGSGI